MKSDLVASSVPFFYFCQIHNIIMQLSLTVVIVILAVFVTGLTTVYIFSSQMRAYSDTQNQMAAGAFAVDCNVECSKVENTDCPPDDWGKDIPGQDFSCFELVGNCECQGENFIVVDLE
jgi:hypothetical protein